ncbi:hypothetical protein P389DRAFT_79542 [Cystobasidium minutum MCA 4210]|uniref:uncharacterized protein n=1 Tax=Cystobasidium minutum MCA 4210 TaxID=1397322 RepID=UPI0034CF6C31|eukprot:jgi/Rhomi1/79542/CE79541_160
MCYLLALSTRPKRDQPSMPTWKDREYIHLHHRCRDSRRIDCRAASLFHFNAIDSFTERTILLYDRASGHRSWTCISQVSSPEAQSKMRGRLVFRFWLRLRLRLWLCFLGRAGMVRMMRVMRMVRMIWVIWVFRMIWPSWVMRVFRSARMMWIVWSARVMRIFRVFGLACVMRILWLSTTCIAVIVVAVMAGPT